MSQVLTTFPTGVSQALLMKCFDVTLQVLHVSQHITTFSTILVQVISANLMVHKACIKVFLKVTYFSHGQR